MKNKPYPYYPCPEPTDLRNLLDICADLYGNKTCLWYRKSNTDILHSFINVRDDVKALGTYFLHNGIANMHIGLLGENSYEWIIAYFAIVNTGNVVVPIDTQLDSYTIKSELEQADVSLVIHSKTYTEEAEYSGIDLMCMDSFDLLFKIGYQNLLEGVSVYNTYDLSIEKMCAIVFTSGTTGEPKGVMLSHKNLTKNAIFCKQNLAATDNCMVILPLYHTFGFMAGVVVTILHGFTIFINSSLKRLTQDIKYSAPEHISVVPMLAIAIYDGIWDNAKKTGKDKQLRLLIKISNGLRRIGFDFRRQLFSKVYAAFGGRLRMIISGGAHIDEKYVKGFDDIGIKITNGYGITECSPIVTTMRDKHYSPLSVGSVHPGIECRIKDGEIQVKGDTVFLGYYNNEKATAEAFDDGWFKTGDLGYFDENNLLYITGRKKNLIILSNGKNVSPEELETIIRDSVDTVKEIIVYGENDLIIAEVYLNPDEEFSEEKVRSEIFEICRVLPPYKQIGEVRFRQTEFDKTPTKKIKRGFYNA